MKKCCACLTSTVSLSLSKPSTSGFEVQIPVWRTKRFISNLVVFPSVVHSCQHSNQKSLQYEEVAIHHLRPDFRGKGRRASNLPGIGQDGEDGWLQGGQDEENLEQSKFGSHVLLAQVQLGLTENDGEGPESQEGGHTKESVDP